MLLGRPRQSSEGSAEVAPTPPAPVRQQWRPLGQNRAGGQEENEDGVRVLRSGFGRF